MGLALPRCAEGTLVLHRSHKGFQKIRALFVLFGGPSQGKRASVSILSCWLKLAIFEVSKAMGKDLPPGSDSSLHYRGCTFAVFEGAASLESTWASPNTVIHQRYSDSEACRVSLTLSVRFWYVPVLEE